MTKVNAGWVPRQHGAWAMIVVPFVVGLLLAGRVRPLTWGDATLGLTWLIGYFAFNALSLTLKSAPARRTRYRTPLMTYSLVAAMFGALTVVSKGAEVLWWTPSYLVLLGWTLWLVAHKQERSALSGTLTVIASCGLMLVLRFGVPQAVVSEFSARALNDIAVIVAVAGYYVGTVRHVKCLIREKNDPDSQKRSATYHLVFAIIVCGLWFARFLHVGWALWSVAVAVRALLIPHKANEWNLTPMRIGLVEIGLSAAVVLLAWIG